MEKLVKRICMQCKKNYQVRLAEIRFRGEPKYCSTVCSGVSKRISPEEKVRRKTAYSRLYYLRKKKALQTSV